MITRLIILIIVFLGLVFNTSAQESIRYNSFAYRVNEGMLQPVVRDLAFDGHNYCWLSYPNGIQKFDGLNFTNVPVQEGLPDDKWVYFFQLRSGNILISHNKGISEYDKSKNSFSFRQKWKNPVANPLNFIGEEKGIVYLISENAEIIELDAVSYKINSRYKIPGFSDKRLITPLHPSIVNGKINLEQHRRILTWDLVRKKAINISDDFNIEGWDLVDTDKAGNPFFTIVTDSVRYYIYDIISRQKNWKFSMPFRPGIPFRSRSSTWHEKKLISIYEKVFEIDPETFKLKTELKDFFKPSFTDGAVIAQMASDNFGSLFIQTINGGLRKLIYNRSSIKFFGTADRKYNYTLAVHADKKANRILVGGYNSGLKIFDTSQTLVWQQLEMRGKASPNIIIKSPDGGYYITCWGSPGLYYLDNNLSNLKPLKCEIPPNTKYQYPAYFSNKLYQDERIAIVQTQNFIFTINFATQSVRVGEIPGTPIIAGIYRSPYLIIHQNDSLRFLDISSLAIKKSVYLPNTGEVRCYLNEDENHFLIGTNKGVFRVDNEGNLVEKKDKSNGIPDECIYAMEYDGDGGLWCSSNKGLFRISNSGSIVQLTMEDGLQENEFNNCVSFKSEDGELFFGGVNGVSSFWPSRILQPDDSLNILMTNIRINNNPLLGQPYWNVNHLDLPHDKNTLAFDFIAMSAGNPSQFIYQYRMLGVDKEWIQNTGTQTVRYFLPPGKYHFQVFASRVFNKHAIPLKEISITIHPQFWKTWWFAVIILIILLSITAYILNLIFKSRYDKKMLKLQAEQKLQSERGRISRDLHDSIGAYANTVLYKTQVLEKEKDEWERSELMDDLKFASRDIITSLRETVWALKNENFNAQDCFIRIRNFVQSFNKFYPGTHFKVEGDAPENYSFESSKALNLVRIVQEAITNAIKHGESKNVFVKSNFDSRSWVIHVKDDGKGFDMNAKSSKEMGNGLSNMAERANESQFIFNIQSMLGKGTEVEIRIGIS